MHLVWLDEIVVRQSSCVSRCSNAVSWPKQGACNVLSSSPAIICTHVVTWARRSSLAQGSQACALVSTCVYNDDNTVSPGPS